jgi:pimeloyl-ACP methyl ester carboxylesterase
VVLSDDGFRHHQVAVSGSLLHVVEAGDPDGVPFLFLHGWPESWRSWLPVMTVAARQARAIAVDLPGVGGSSGAATDGSKRQLAAVVHELATALGLREATLVGQDVGGMIVYSYLRAYRDIARAVIMDVVLPGVDPWEEVLRNPYIWHFALHTIPALPERLVQGRQQEYFDYFYDVLSHDPARITADARAAYAQAYATDGALSAGFSWYRGFARDAAENREAAAGPPVRTPLLYLRGEHERGDIDAYVRGLREAGVVHVDHGLVPDAGHFTQEEAPEQTWRLIAGFAGL